MAKVFFAMQLLVGFLFGQLCFAIDLDELIVQMRKRKEVNHDFPSIFLHLNIEIPV